MDREKPTHYHEIVAPLKELIDMALNPDDLDLWDRQAEIGEVPQLPEDFHTQVAKSVVKNHAQEQGRADNWIRKG